MTSATPETQAAGEPPATQPPRIWPLVAAVSGLVGICAWVYWPSLTEMFRTWGADPQYSHGYLVPLFVVVLLWIRRPILFGLSPARIGGTPQAPPEDPPALKPADYWGLLAELSGSWWGVGLLVVAGALRLAGAFLNYDWIADVSLLPCLAGLFLLLGGWRALAWSWPAVAFLAFMIPLPFSTTYALSGPLRGLATTISTYVLQTVGLPALAEGHTILLPSGPIAVAEACSGLSMLFVFLAISLGMVLVVDRPWLDKAVILASAIPIALVANVVRIVVTGLAQEYFGRKTADVVFHDLAGWLMMPLALGVLWLELKVTDWVLEVPQRPETVVPGVSGVSGVGKCPSPGATVLRKAVSPKDRASIAGKQGT